MMISMTIKGTPTKSMDRFNEYIEKRNKVFKSFDLDRIAKVMEQYGETPLTDCPDTWEYVARTVLKCKPTTHQRAEAHRILDELNCKY